MILTYNILNILNIESINIIFNIYQEIVKYQTNTEVTCHIITMHYKIKIIIFNITNDNIK